MQKRVERSKEKLKNQIKNLYEKGFSMTEIAEKKNVPYNFVWKTTQIPKKGFSSENQYKKQNLKKNGFETTWEYQQYLTKIRQKNKKNKELSNLIQARLKELKKSSTWLGEQIDVSKMAVSEYARGRYVPQEETLKKLFQALSVPYQTIDDLLEDKDSANRL